MEDVMSVEDRTMSMCFLHFSHFQSACLFQEWCDNVVNEPLLLKLQVFSVWCQEMKASRWFQLLQSKAILEIHKEVRGLRKQSCKAQMIWTENSHEVTTLPLKLPWYRHDTTKNLLTFGFSFDKCSYVTHHYPNSHTMEQDELKKKNPNNC